MFFKSLIVSIAVMTLSGAAIAQAAVPASPAPGFNPHQSHDQKMRLCKQQAEQQGLVGDQKQAYVANCFKKP